MPTITSATTGSRGQRLTRWKHITRQDKDDKRLFQHKDKEENGCPPTSFWEEDYGVNVLATSNFTKAEHSSFDVDKFIGSFGLKLCPTPLSSANTFSFTMTTPQKAFAIGVSNSVSKVLQRRSSKSRNGNARSINSRSSNEKKQVLSKRIHMTGIVLESVSPHKKLRISSPSSPDDTEGQVLPWANEQLPTTQRNEELLSDTLADSVGNSTPKSFSPQSTDSTKEATADSLHPMLEGGDEVNVVGAVNNTNEKKENEEAVDPRQALIDAIKKRGNGGDDYRQMLKVGVPKDDVRHAMEKEGVRQKIVEAVLGREDAINTSNNMEPAKRRKNTKTKRMHWTANNLRGDSLKESIFARGATKKRKLSEDAEREKLEELFPKNDNVRTGKVKGGDSNAGSGMAKLLDITRANNISIQLKAFNDFTLRALAETINDLDPDSKIVGEHVQFIPQLLPTPKELQAIKKYKGESDRLNTAELFFQQLLPVKRVEDKVAVLKAMSTFHEHAEDVRAAFKTLKEVCGQVVNSERLKEIVMEVLDVGNLMNEGTLDGGVEAFKFESLPKLSETKGGADGKTTVLDFIVEKFIEEGRRDTLFLDSDFPDIQESCRLSINDLSGALITLRKNYQLCKTELNSMKKDQAPTPAKDAQKNDEGEAVDPRKALFAAIQNRGTNGDESSSKPAPVDPRKDLFAAKDAEDCNASAPSSNVKYSRGVERLESFVEKAEASLSLIDGDQGAAIEACQALAVYCGEEGGERAASSLLQILSGFSSSLKTAVKKYERRQKAQKNKSIPQKLGKENQVNAALPKSNELLRAQSKNDGNARRAMFAEMKVKQEAQKNESIPQKLDKENQVNGSALPKNNQSKLQPRVGLSGEVEGVSSSPNNTLSELATARPGHKENQVNSPLLSEELKFLMDRPNNSKPSRISMVRKMLAPANLRRLFANNKKGPLSQMIPGQNYSQQTGELHN